MSLPVGSGPKSNVFFETIRRTAPRSISEQRLNQIVNEALSPKPSSSSLALENVTKDFGDLAAFVSFIDKTLEIAAECGIISEEKMEGQQTRLYEALIEKGEHLTQKNLETLPLKFQALFYHKNFDMLKDHYLKIGEQRGEELVLQVAENGITQGLFDCFVGLNLSSKAMHQILLMYSKESPENFLYILTNLKTMSRTHERSFNFSEAEKAELLKSAFVDPDHLKKLIDAMKINSLERKLDLIRFHLSIHPDETLFKLENFAELSSDQKYQLFREAVALHPRLISSWKAALMTKTRKELATRSCLVDVLMTFDQEKEEGVAKMRVLEKFEMEKEKSDAAKEVHQLVKAAFSSDKMQFLQQRDLSIWFAAVLDDLKDLPEVNTARFKALITDLSLMDSSLRYPLSAILLRLKILGRMKSAVLPDNAGDLSVRVFKILGLSDTNITQMNRLTSSQLCFASSVLFTLFLTPSISPRGKKHILDDLKCAKNSEELYHKMQAIYALLNISKGRLADLNSGDCILTFAETMESLLPVKIPDPFQFMNSYSATFGSFRIPEAFVLYADSLQNLPEGEEKRKVLGAFSVLMQEAFSGTFTEMRYDTRLSSHLDRVLRLQPGMLDRWKENSVSAPVSEFLKDGARESLMGCTVQETDRLEDMFLLATEVPGSCLSARGNPDDNKSFASYPLDGKNKLFCVKDAEGKMIGRALVRLLLDKNNNPVLLLDTFFSSIPYAEGKERPSPYEQLSESITEAVKKKASLLQVPLLKTYSSSDKEHPEYGLSVLSHGGRAPLECVNAIGAQGDDELCKDSVYEIRQTQVLFVPVR